VTGSQVILALKVAVSAVTVLLAASAIALARGNIRLHGRINMVFFALTVTAVCSLEIIVRFINPDIFSYLDESAKRALSVHLCFSVPSALVLPVMLFTGLSHRRVIHIALGSVFAILWTGTVITGLFFLPSG
jgi:uncharacterized membrane protein YozB (DUF420 family)